MSQPVPGRSDAADSDDGAKDRQKSVPVIPRSQRVRELPPPPKVPGQPVASDSELVVSARAPDVPIQLAELEIEPSGRQPWWRRRRTIQGPSRLEQWLAAPRRRDPVSYAISLMVHLALLLLLIVGAVMARPQQASRLVGVRSFVETPVAAADLGGPWVSQVPSKDLPTSFEPPRQPAATTVASVPAVDRVPVVVPAVAPSANSTPPKGNDAKTATSKPSSDRTAKAETKVPEDTPVDGKLRSRTVSGRGAGIRYGHGNAQSEAAVQAALKWLVAHQRDDGGWSFNHVNDGCRHYCTNPGTEASRTAATALALLPFLGSGNTHKEGEYQDVVQRGLDFIVKRGVLISYGNDLRDGSMYGQGLATIALCEAYAMTQDPMLREPAQGGIKFIVWAQHEAGGWRYTPGAPGDTTVTGWLLMALKSGQMARLQVPSPAIFQAKHFLSSVESQDGALYGYMTRRPRKTTTAVGLLCRMYTGWQHDNPALAKGMAYLYQWGPAEDNIYYNYYATYAMFHYGGPQWDGWNKKMRDSLIATQSRTSHAAGSWYFAGNYGEVGGRLYNTAMAAMILEVYYRSMPLYKENAVDGKF